MGVIEIAQRSTPPTPPSTGRTNVYVDDAGRLQVQDSGGRLVGARDGLFASTQTSGVTPATLAFWVVPASSMLLLRGWVWGLEDTATATASRYVEGLFYRSGSGNVTLVGQNSTTLLTNSATAPTITLLANVAQQRAEVEVIGVALQDWLWRARLVAEAIP